MKTCPHCGHPMEEWPAELLYVWNNSQSPTIKTMLSLLWQRRNGLVPTERFISEIYNGNEPDKAKAIIHVQITRMRKQLKSKGWNVVNVYSEGYKLVKEI